MPQPPKPLDPTASPQAWFGHEVRDRRNAAKLSQAALGRRVQVSAAVIGYLERGDYPSCQQWLAQALDKALDADGLFAGAWGMAFKARDADKSVGDAEKPVRGRSSAPARGPAPRILGGDDLSPPPESAETVERRSFLQASGLAALSPIVLAQAAPTAEAAAPTAIRPADIEQIRRLAEVISLEDHKLGGGGLVRRVAGSTMQWATQLLHAECQPALRQPLYAAVSRLGIVVGATAFDAYHHGEAVAAFRLAAECAEEAGDWHLRAKTYSYLARHSVWLSQPDDGLTYAEKGLVRRDRLTATEQAMLHTARARAFAKLGLVRETMLAVGDADAAFEHTDPVSDPSWMAYYDEAQHHGDTGHALYDLAVHAGQDPGRASRRLATAVEQHTDAYARSRAISRTKLASLLMHREDPREAAHIGNRALDEVGPLTSKRARDDLRELGRAAGEHPQVREAVDLRARIAATVAA
ncbi:helix-turn-helix domain-containing protein [Streptomyces albidoflavus]|uniref:helix-turn-helix domain-containing protein n=1 Tax=Streptomyces albidoflavus TaxID=1886 RepID=UPI00342B54AF